jgi:serine/threonine protein kinase
VRGIVDRIAKGLRAFHRLEMLHQDLRAENVIAQCTAPEYFFDQNGTTRSDLFSLGVITYQMLAGKLPYGAEVAKTRTAAAQRNLQYQPIREGRPEIPAWVDEAIGKAVHPNPLKRYEDIAEFVYDLHHPNEAFLTRTRAPLIERNPAVFWKSVSFILMAVLIVVLAMQSTVK